jgi:signal recognition particle GTPase
VSIGQEYDEFRKFDPDWMVERIFGDKQPIAAQDL